MSTMPNPLSGLGRRPRPQQPLAPVRPARAVGATIGMALLAVVLAFLGAFAIGRASRPSATQSGQPGAVIVATGTGVPASLPAVAPIALPGAPASTVVARSPAHSRTRAARAGAGTTRRLVATPPSAPPAPRAQAPAETPREAAPPAREAPAPTSSAAGGASGGQPRGSGSPARSPGGSGGPVTFDSSG